MCYACEKTRAQGGKWLVSHGIRQKASLPLCGTFFIQVPQALLQQLLVKKLLASPLQPFTPEYMDPVQRLSLGIDMTCPPHPLSLAHRLLDRAVTPANQLMWLESFRFTTTLKPSLV